MPNLHKITNSGNQGAGRFPAFRPTEWQKMHGVRSAYGNPISIRFYPWVSANHRRSMDAAKDNGVL